MRPSIRLDSGLLSPDRLPLGGPALVLVDEDDLAAAGGIGGQGLPDASRVEGVGDQRQGSRIRPAVVRRQMGKGADELAAVHQPGEPRDALGLGGADVEVSEKANATWPPGNWVEWVESTRIQPGPSCCANTLSSTGPARA
jgi:hypothetical protein